MEDIKIYQNRIIESELNSVKNVTRRILKMDGNLVRLILGRLLTLEEVRVRSHLEWELVRHTLWTLQAQIVHTTWHIRCDGDNKLNSIGKLRAALIIQSAALSSLVFALLDRLQLSLDTRVREQHLCCSVDIKTSGLNLYSCTNLTARREEITHSELLRIERCGQKGTEDRQYNLYAFHRTTFLHP